MPVRDCMSGSPFCPANQSSKFAIPGCDEKGCDACVEESLNKNEIPKCFHNKFEEAGSFGSTDFSFSSFAKKVMDLKNRTNG